MSDDQIDDLVQESKAILKAVSQELPTEKDFATDPKGYKAKALVNLDRLGLGFLVNNVPIPDQEWLQIFRFTEYVQRNVVFDPPSDSEKTKWLYITAMSGLPDLHGWIKLDEYKLRAPYWIPKAKIRMLSELEFYLRGLRIG